MLSFGFVGVLFSVIGLHNDSCFGECYLRSPKAETLIVVWSILVYCSMTVLSPTDDWLIMVSFYWMYDCLNESFPPCKNEPFIDSFICMNEPLFDGLGFIL